VSSATLERSVRDAIGSRPALTLVEQAKRGNREYVERWGSLGPLADWQGSRGGLEIRERLDRLDAGELAKVLSGGYCKLSDRERDAIARGEATLATMPDGGYRVIPFVGGGALGQGAVYARNLPAPGTFDINPVLFAAKTSRNRKINPQQNHPGYTASLNFRVDAVGIVAKLYVVFEATLTSGASAATVTNHWPWNLAKSIVVSANGISNLFSFQGLDARSLMRVRNAKWFWDRESLFAIPAATLASTVRLIYELPLAYDESLVGAVFAQTEETQLTVTVTTAASADLFSANAGTFSAATWRIVSEFYSIPTADTQAGRVLVLPDISQLHGVVSRDDAFSSAAVDITSPLTRTGGILLRAAQRIDNPNPGDTAFGGSSLGGTVTSHRFRYGGNVVPLDIPGYLARYINSQDYGDNLLPSTDVVSGATAPAYAWDDFVIDSPLRDVIHLTGITEAQLLNALASGTTVNAGAQVHTVQEAMVAG
jgi:hypothetical protein